MVEKLRYYLWHLNEKGFIELVQQVLCDYYYNKKFLNYNFTPYQSSSLDVHQASEEVMNKSQGKDGYMNSPSSYYYILKCFSCTKNEASKTTLLDLGCGNGKLLVVGMTLRFAKVYGVDLDSDALSIAKMNCKKAQHQTDDTPYELINEDAAIYKIPEDVNTIFMYNPFGANTLKQVIINIENSYMLNKRKIHVLYYSPQFADLFDENKLFNKLFESRLKTGRPDVVIYSITH